MNDDLRKKLNLSEMPSANPDSNQPVAVELGFEKLHPWFFSDNGDEVESGARGAQLAGDIDLRSILEIIREQMNSPEGKGMRHHLRDEPRAMLMVMGVNLFMYDIQDKIARRFGRRPNLDFVIGRIHDVLWMRAGKSTHEAAAEQAKSPQRIEWAMLAQTMMFANCLRHTLDDCIESHKKFSDWYDAAIHLLHETCAMIEADAVSGAARIGAFIPQKGSRA